MTRSKVILVCGAGRSATSMVARALHESGTSMGDNLMPAGPGNPHGYYEDLPAVALNNAVLDAHGYTWRTVADGLEVEHLSLVELVGDYIDGRGRGPWGVKDPRLTMTLGYWLAAFAQREHLEPIVVGCIRGTLGVARSLAQREGMDIIEAIAVTRHYRLELARVAESQLG